MSDTEAPEAPEVVLPSTDASPKEDDLKPDEGKAPLSADQLQAELAKVRKEAAAYRTKLREAEPLVKAAREAEDANKTEVQRAQERVAKAEEKYATLQKDNWRLELAAENKVPRDKIHLIGSGSREEMEKNAADLGELFASVQKTPAPPSDRPVEGLRPGATPDPPKPEDNSYPAAWGFQPSRKT